MTIDFILEHPSHVVVGSWIASTNPYITREYSTLQRVDRIQVFPVQEDQVGATRFLVKIKLWTKEYPVSENAGAVATSYLGVAAPITSGPVPPIYGIRSQQLSDIFHVFDSVVEGVEEVGS